MALSSQTSRPCLPGLVGILADLALPLSFLRCYRDQAKALQGQGNLLFTTLQGPKEALLQLSPARVLALCGPRFRPSPREGAQQGPLTSQRCCVFLTAPVCTFSGGKSTPWKGPIQVPCWILCAAQMP